MVGLGSLLHTQPLVHAVGFGDEVNRSEWGIRRSEVCSALWPWQVTPC